MSNRPDIALALDVRSDENVVVVSKDLDAQYPTWWVRPQSVHETAVDPGSVVVVDRVELSRRSFAQLAAGCPRLFAFIVPPGGIEYEKQVRRMVTALYPWSELWTIWTSMGKALVTKDAKGDAYEWSA